MTTPNHSLKTTARAVAVQRIGGFLSLHKSGRVLAWSLECIVTPTVIRAFCFCVLQ